MVSSTVDDQTKDAISAIVTPFLIANRQSDDAYHDLMGKLYTRFQFGDAEADSIKSMLVNGPDIRMFTANKFMRFGIVEKEGMYPFVTMHSTENWNNVRIYVLFLKLDEIGELQSLAIRFESRETGRTETEGLHDFFHAQLCDHINKNVTEIGAKWVPCTQPSIPLDAQDDVSLVLCMLVSIYGARVVMQKLNSAGVNEYRKYIGKIGALGGRIDP